MPAHDEALRQPAKAFAATQHRLAASRTCYDLLLLVTCASQLGFAHGYDILLGEPGGVDQGRSQLTFPFTSFVTLQVLLAGLAALQLAASRRLEAFARAFMGLHLRHGWLSVINNGAPGGGQGSREVISSRHKLWKGVLYRQTWKSAG